MWDQSFVPNEKGSLIKLMLRGQVTWPLPVSAGSEMIVRLRNSRNCPWGIWLSQVDEKREGEASIHYHLSWELAAPWPRGTFISPGWFYPSSHSFMCGLNYFLIPLQMVIFPGKRWAKVLCDSNIRYCIHIHSISIQWKQKVSLLKDYVMKLME